MRFLILKGECCGSYTVTAEKRKGEKEHLKK
jgi:hypothetical protein